MLHYMVYDIKGNYFYELATFKVFTMGDTFVDHEGNEVKVITRVQKGKGDLYGKRNLSKQSE